MITDTDLDLIFEYGNTNQHKELIELLQKIWHWPEYIKYENGKLELHTGGWEENEDIIDILSQTTFWEFFWLKSERGGHYYFEIWNGDKMKGAEPTDNYEDDFEQF
jgi:hypothetical protein